MTNHHDKVNNSKNNDISRMEHVVNDLQELDVDNMTSDEMHFLNNRLDELNSALDTWEEKNDLIHARLVELLASNREIREQLKESMQQPENEEKPKE